MKKDKLSSWTLALAVAFFFLGLSSLYTANSSRILGFLSCMAGIALGVATWVLRASIKKDYERHQAEIREAEEKLRQDREAEHQLKEQALRERAEDLARRTREFEERYVIMRFPVAGVTFKNEDKISRQDVLKAICQNGSEGEADVWFEDSIGDGSDDRGIQVVTDEGCVGYIRRNDKEEVRNFFGKTVCSQKLEAEKFDAEDGPLYRADVVIVIDRKDPREAWYFEDTDA